ncbi:hypothetical protein CKO35_04030 [Ectothiorhodospira shaposhnikovii]|nr:hypothetical protein [Ectothiorhodospira shaposhnikovii]
MPHYYREPPDRGVLLMQRHELLQLLSEVTGRDARDATGNQLRNWGRTLVADHARAREQAVTIGGMREDLRRLESTAGETAANLAEKSAILEETQSCLRLTQARLHETEVAMVHWRTHFESVAGSLSFRVGRRMTLPVRLIRGGVFRGWRFLREPALVRMRLARLRALLVREGWREVLRRLAQPGASIFLEAPASAASPQPEQARGEYALWWQHHGRPDDAERRRMVEWVGAMSNPPLLSVVMPVFNTDPALLRQTLDSLREQLYPHWELCVADDASTREGTREVLTEFSQRDDRVRVIWRECNGHISAASNSALSLARGDYVVLMDHDDLLTEDALYWVARTIDERPGVGLIYSDEDKVDDRGHHYDPYFKPDWNPDLLGSQNYVNHLCVYRADLVRRVGGFREGFEGSQDYDLLLRVIENLSAESVVHIPRILYHWRAVAGSEALEAGVKDYARDSARRALTEHLARRGVQGEVMEAEECPGMWRIRYALPDPVPKVSVIVPTRNGLVLLTRCLETLLHRTDYPDMEILVVDNGSDDPAVLGYLSGLERQGRIKVIRDDRPFNFSALNNRAAAEAHGEVLVLLNNDVEIIQPDWLREMVGHAMRPEIGAVGARLWYPDDTLQHGGVVLGIGGVAGHAFKGLPRGRTGYFGRTSLIQNYSAVTAACLAVRREVFMEVGGLDEQHLAVAFNDIDFCIKVRDRGYRNLWTPYAELYHHESATRGYEDTPEKQRRFAGEVRVMLDRWGQGLLHDPAYNPNLSLDREDFALARMPRHLLPGQSLRP